MASVYLRPSWKMWPSSMPRASSTVPLPLGEGSPALISAASMNPSTVKSRPAFRSVLADQISGLAPAPHYAQLDF